ncbi:MAG: NAD-dependent epimerase/dehydratase family protein [Mogibacterium sp.]|nr:NAD-dependent epimerase/dehydratase family protein [Mogibacterium sp.]MBR2539206.1 NAD-dependent epimerase/dehydratase family protein [Mogibacterium sp.]
MKIDKFENSIITEDVERIISEDLPWERFRGTTVLITGASGMIPSYVLYTMLGLNDSMDMGIRILALVRNEQKARGIFGTLLERDDIELIVQDVSIPVCYDGPVDYIFHGGSAARPREHKAAPTSTIRANLMGTFNLLDLAVEKKSKGFVLMSSSEVYGQVPAGTERISETDYGYIDCLNPRSCYSEGKRAAETICTSFRAQYGIDCKLPRFAHIYGPGLALNDGRVQADFAANVFRGEDIVMNSDGSSQRAYTYVADAVSGIFYVLLKGDDMAYNIADSGSIISIRQLAEAFIACRPEKGLKLVMNIDQSQAASYNPAKFIGLDDSKIRALGWTPKVSVAEGVGRMISNYEITENR